MGHVSRHPPGVGRGEQHVECGPLLAATEVVVVAQRQNRAEEAVVEDLEKLQRGLVDHDSGRAAVHEGDVDDGRVVVAGVLLGAEDGCQSREAAVGLPVAAGVAPV